MSNERRFPGTKPFEQSEKQLFFGRTDDTLKLSRLIELEQLVVLFGKSGMGKTSLLNAGILPYLDETENFEPIFMRFGSYIPENEQSLKEIFTDRIAPKFEMEKTLDKIIPNENSLWYFLKNLQFNLPNRQGFILVLDQFEEFFTFPERDVYEFARELSETANEILPQRFREKIREIRRKKPKFLNAEQLRFLYQPINLKIVISIRTDKINLLSRLSSLFPDILRHNYELNALNRVKAELAIMGPSGKNGDFISPKFSLTQEALEAILDELSDTGQQAIECFQLQVICKHLEDIAIKRQERFENSPIKVNHDLEHLLTLKEIGKIKGVLRSHYQRQLDIIKLKLSEAHADQAQVLLEEKLIFEKEEKRITLYQGQIIDDFKIETELLDILVDLRLLRRERYAIGYYYELSHDSFVKPLLEVKRERKLKELKEKAEKEFEEKQRLQNKYKELDDLRKRKEYEREALQVRRREIQKSQRDARSGAISFFKKQYRNQPFKKRFWFSAFVFTVSVIILGAIIGSIYFGFQSQNQKTQIEQTKKELENLNRDLEKLINQSDTANASELLRNYIDLEDKLNK